MTDEQTARDIHSRVLEAFDAGVQMPPSGRDRVRTDPETKTVCFAPRYFHVRSPRSPTSFDTFLAAIALEAAALERSGEYQVATFIGGNYVSAVASSVVESELGVKHFAINGCWRLADRRQL